MIGIYVLQAVHSHFLCFFILRVELASSGKLLCDKYQIDGNHFTRISTEDSWKAVIGNGPLVAFVSGTHFKIFSLQSDSISGETGSFWTLLLEGYMEEVTSRLDTLSVPLLVESGMLCCSVVDVSKASYSLVCCFWSDSTKNLRFMTLSFPSRVVALCKGGRNLHDKHVLYVLTETELFQWEYGRILVMNEDRTSHMYDDTVPDVRKVGPIQVSSKDVQMTALSYHQKRYLLIYTIGDVGSYLQVAELDRCFCVVANHHLSESLALYVFFAGEIWMLCGDVHHSSHIALSHISHFLTENNWNRNPCNDTVGENKSQAKEQFVNSLRGRLDTADLWISQLRRNCANALCCLKYAYYARITEGTHAWFHEIPEWAIEFPNFKTEELSFDISKETSWLKSLLVRNRENCILERTLEPLAEHRLFYRLEEPNNGRILGCFAVGRNGTRCPPVTFVRQGTLLEVHIEYSSLVTFEGVDVLVVLSSDTQRDFRHVECRLDAQNNFFARALNLENSHVLLLHLQKPTDLDSVSKMASDNTSVDFSKSLLNCQLTRCIGDYNSKSLLLINSLEKLTKAHLCMCVFIIGHIRKWDLCILLDDIFVIRCSSQDIRLLIHRVLEAVPKLVCWKDEIDSSWWVSKDKMLVLQLLWGDFWNHKHIYVSGYCNSWEIFEYICTNLLTTLHNLVGGTVKLKDVVDNQFIAIADSCIKKLNKEWNYIQNVGLSQVSPVSWYSIVQQTDEQMVILNAYVQHKFVSHRLSKKQGKPHERKKQMG